MLRLSKSVEIALVDRNRAVHCRESNHWLAASELNALVVVIEVFACVIAARAGEG